jgi:hypothetical protein
MGLGLLLLLTACEKRSPEPKTYDDAVTRCDEYVRRIEKEIERGRLADVHDTAEKAKELADRLPDLARDQGAPEEVLEPIEINAKALGDNLDTIHEEADEGQLRLTRVVLAQIKFLIGELKRLSGKLHGDGTF